MVASQLRIDDASIDDAHRLDELGLAPLNLVLVVLRLEDLDGGGGSFPLATLDRVRTVGDLVTLVGLWLRRDTMPSPTETKGPHRSGARDQMGDRK